MSVDPARSFWHAKKKRFLMKIMVYINERTNQIRYINERTNQIRENNKRHKVFEFVQQAFQ